MEKFPEHYKRPQLLDITKAAVTGWTAVCDAGGVPITITPDCHPGTAFSKEFNDGFIPPEVLQQGF